MGVEARPDPADDTDNDLECNSGTFMGPGGTCGIGCCTFATWEFEVNFGGGEEVGMRMIFVVSWAIDGGGAFTPLDTWISVNIRSSSENPPKVADIFTGSSSFSEESISPLSTAACGWGFG